MTASAKTIASRLEHHYIRRLSRQQWLRRGLILTAMLVVLVTLGAFGRRGDQSIYSPGTLTSAHSMLDGNQCSWCHEPQAGGGFSQVVTDSACTRCHDGSIHHPNQATLVALDAAKTPIQSANCMACHIEHRGHEQLVSAHNSQCTQCHADLTPATRDGKPLMQPNVHGFAAGSHPPFGRSLTDSRLWTSSPQTLRDPTPLRYNHAQAAHVAIKPLAGQKQNCTVCHESAADRWGTEDRASIAPVSYDRNCASCHKLELVAGSGLMVPHTSFDVVRSTLAGVIPDLTRRYRQELEEMTAVERDKALVTVRTIRQPAPRPPKREEVRITPDEWVAKRVTVATGQFKKWYEEVGPSIPEFETVRSTVEASDREAPGGLPKADPWTDPRVLELMVARVQPGTKQNRCNLCHDLSDNANAVDVLRRLAGPPMNAASLAWITERSRPAEAAATPAVSPPATGSTTALTTLAAAPAKALEIVPTGIGPGPRQWYIHSRFDHSAHRLMSCVDCHGNAPSSERTSDVLLPAIESCTACHAPRPTGSLTGGATTSCTACHHYHDHSLERSGTRSLKPSDLLRSGPSAADAKSAPAPKSPTP